MNEIITLIHDNGSRRDVFCRICSIGQTEFYQAQATGYKPEIKFVIADYWDYSYETMVKHDGQLYRVIRIYRAGKELEITVTRASAEEVALYG